MATAAALTIAFLGAGSENTLWDFQFGFVGSTLAGLLTVYILDSRWQERWRILAAWLALISGLMCSGIGLTSIVIAGVYSVIRLGWQRAIAVCSVPGIAYLLWYATYGHKGVTTADRKALHAAQYIDYFVAGVSWIWGSTLGSSLAGGILIIVLAASAVLLKSTPRLKALAIAGLVGVVFEFALQAAVRAQYGTVEARSSRYVYCAGVMSMPALVHLTQSLWATIRARSVPLIVQALVAITVLSLIPLGIWRGNILQLRFFDSREATAASSRSKIVAAEVLVRTKPLLLNERPDPVYSPNVTASRLEDRDVQKAFGNVIPGEGAIVDAEETLLTAIQPAPTVARFVDRLASWELTNRPAPSRCTSEPASGATEFALPGTRTGQQLSLVGYHGPILSYLTDHGVRTVTRETDATGPVTYIAISAPGAVLHIEAPSAPFQICLGGATPVTVKGP